MKSDKHIIPCAPIRGIKIDCAHGTLLFKKNASGNPKCLFLMLMRHRGQGSSFKAPRPWAGLGVHTSRMGLVRTGGLVEAGRRPPQAPGATEHKPAHLLLRAAWTGPVTIAEGDGVADHGDCHHGPGGMTPPRGRPPCGPHLLH